jgi:4'-phosphopantetheinyl transferase
MNIYWLEQTEGNVPLTNDWLSANEKACLNALRFLKRRADWRLGRWTAKCAISAYLSLPSALESFREVEILQATDGAPEVSVNGHAAAVTISLSHRSGVAICAVAPTITHLGCDVESVEPRSHEFVTDYFTAEEQAQVARTTADEHDQIVTLLWSAKESALKALRAGLRLDTRTVIVNVQNPSSDHNQWSALSVRHIGYLLPKSVLPKDHLPRHLLPQDFESEERYRGEQVFDGWWRTANGIVRTMVAAPKPELPTLLATPEHGESKPCSSQSSIEFESKAGVRVA